MLCIQSSMIIHMGILSSLNLPGENLSWSPLCAFILICGINLLQLSISMQTKNKHPFLMHLISACDCPTKLNRDSNRKIFTSLSLEYNMKLQLFFYFSFWKIQSECIQWWIAYYCIATLIIPFKPFPIFSCESNKLCFLLGFYVIDQHRISIGLNILQNTVWSIILLHHYFKTRLFTYCTLTCFGPF